MERCKDPVYMHEWYLKNRETILARNKERYWHLDECYETEIERLNAKIKKILGHNPTWWEREYWME